MILHALLAVSMPKAVLECLALKQRAEHAKIFNFIERSKVTKSNHAFLPKGIQIEDLPRPPAMPSESARSAC